MKRILHIQKVTGISGSEKHLLTLLPRMVSDQYDMTFLALIEPEIPVTNFIDQLSAAGVSTDRLIMRAHIDPFCLFNLYRYMKRRQYDLVHTHLIHADLYGTFAAKMARVPHIVSTKHGYTEPGVRARLYGLNRLFHRYVDRVITISNALQKHKTDIEGIPPEKMVTIYYALDETPPFDRSRRKETRRGLGLSESAQVAIVVGRLIEVKGHRFLLPAVREILDGGHEIHVLVVGDGPLRHELEELSCSLGLEQAISFLGYRKDIWDLLDASDIFVLPTLGEGFGLAVLEAMASGRPVVATNVTSLPEIVLDGVTGILVPPMDVVSLTEAICKLIQDRDLAEKMGKAGFARAKGIFSPLKMVRETEELYRALFH